MKSSELEYAFGSGKWVFVDWMGIDPGYGTSWGGGEGDGFCIPEGVSLKAHRVLADTEPALFADRPWENCQIGAYCTVMKDDSLFRCWYEPYYMKDGKAAQPGIAYAESDDGVSWRKPELGMTDFAGSKANNLVDLGTRGWAHGQSVMKDPSAPPEARYKMVSCGCDKERSIAAAVSPDGLRWTWVEPILTGNNSDTQNILNWNPDTRLYVLYTRQTDGSMHRRGVNRSVSPVFGDFPPSVPVLESSPLDAPDRDIYCNGYSPWPGATDAHVMRLSVYNHTSDTMRVHLAVSRDERIWHEPLGRMPWVIPAPQPAAPLISVYACSGIVSTASNEWSTFAAATHAGHNDPAKHAAGRNREGLLRVPMREDGFISLSAEGHGTFTTIPFLVESDALRLNACSGYSGYIRCEALEAGLGGTGEAVTVGKPIPGFALDDCASAKGDGALLPLTWRGGALGALKGKTVRLRFSLYKTDLYALVFGAV